MRNGTVLDMQSYMLPTALQLYTRISDYYMVFSPFFLFVIGYFIFKLARDK
jgi:hypothetical protein